MNALHALQAARYPLLSQLSGTSLVFQHIPKCGGTSLHELLQVHFPPEKICPERFNELIFYPQSQLENFCFYSGHYDRNNVQFVPGKTKIFTLLRNPADRIVSLYRFWRAHKPEAMTEHHLAASVARNKCLLEFLRHRDDAVPQNINNYMVRYLSGHIKLDEDGQFTESPRRMLRQAIEHLNSMDCFGLLEYLGDFVELLFSRLGLPVPTTLPHLKDHRKFNEDPSLEAADHGSITSDVYSELKKHTHLDDKLYAYAKYTFLKRLAKKQHKPMAKMPLRECATAYKVKLSLLLLPPG